MIKYKRLILLILILGFLFSCHPGLKVTKKDSEAMQTLVSLMFFCGMLSQENSDANCTFINLENYGILEKAGIKLNPDVNISIAILDNKFSATASHISSEMVFSLDSSGKVAPITQ